MYILKKGIIVAIIILIIAYLGSAKLTYDNLQNVSKENVTEENSEEQEKIEYSLTEEFNNNWYIEIPKIDLIAPIAEGTSQEVMSKNVGHFENTELWEGNIGLAAHNRRVSSKLFWKN